MSGPSSLHYQRRTAQWAFFQGVVSILVFSFATAIGLNQSYFYAVIYEGQAPQLLPTDPNPVQVLGFLFVLFYVVLTYHISFYSTHRTNRLLTPEIYHEWRLYVQMVVITGLVLPWPATALVYIVELQTYSPEVERAFGALAYLLFCMMNIPFEVLALSSSWFIFPLLPRPLRWVIGVLLLAQVISIGLSIYPRSPVSFGLPILLQIVWHILIGAFLWLRAEDGAESRG